MNHIIWSIIYFTCHLIPRNEVKPYLPFEDIAFVFTQSVKVIKPVIKTWKAFGHLLIPFEFHLNELVWDVQVYEKKN